MERERIENKPQPPADLQTASLFLVLALLTGLFILGLKWVFLTPNTGVSTPAAVESASKQNN